MLTIGDVEILPDQRRVLVAKKPFNLGSRAFDMLELLASAGGNLVSKNEIMRRVWPDTVVADNNLHIHISAIRKMLGASSKRLIAVPGRGYRLALEPQDSPSESQSGCAGRAAGPAAVRSNFPSPGSMLYGRDAAIDEVIDASASSALVCLVGPGGIGKTRLAIEAARQVAHANRSVVARHEQTSGRGHLAGHCAAQ
jgi:DNA-binding winged helix-turn-helix (wHTH) protein